MEISQTGLALFIAASFILGILIGVFHDLTAILPAVAGKVFDRPLYEKLSGKFPHLPGVKRNKFMSGAAEFVHDTVSLAAAGCAVPLLIYLFNDGVFRISAMAALAGGAAVYAALLRRFTLKLAELNRFLCFFLLYYLTYPIRAAVKFICKCVVKIRLSAYDRRAVKRLMRLSENGFLNIKIKGNERYDGRNKEKKNNAVDNLGAARRGGDNLGGQSYELQPSEAGNDPSGA